MSCEAKSMKNLLHFSQPIHIGLPWKDKVEEGRTRVEGMGKMPLVQKGSQGKYLDKALYVYVFES